MILQDRIQTYTEISSFLESKTDEEISVLLENTESESSSIGGKSSVLNINGKRVFVKKVPITRNEMLPENKNSTANLFNLPTFYQYGVGSTGFGVWRELAAHKITTQWVLENKLPNFPVLYHYRILSSCMPDVLSDEKRQDIESQVAYWENNPQIKKRLEQLYTAPKELVLFLEYVPMTLHEWLNNTFTADMSSPEKVAENVLAQLTKVNDFLKSHCFIHFDAHFENLLTDGELILFSDFGLAVSTEFDLSKEEQLFFDKHLSSYDQACAILNLAHSAFSAFIKRPIAPISLKKLLEMKSSNFPEPLDEVIEKQMTVALAMDEFFTALQAYSKNSQYPHKLMQRLLCR